MKVDPVELTRKLIRIDSTAGKENSCASLLGGMLEDAGFEVSFHDLEPGRTNLIAKLKGKTDALPLCFSGHVDIVPFGENPWEKDPLDADISNGRIYGRGSSDMKSGVAAITSAALSLASMGIPEKGLTLIITAAEEEACRGALFLLENRLIPKAGALMIAEPTSNVPVIGHKGALWLEISTSGRTAHGSMPEEGENAIYKLAGAVIKLKDCSFEQENSILGRPTLNVGKIEGGINYNIVPDYASALIDIRTVPETPHRDILKKLEGLMGKDIDISVKVDMEGFVCDPTCPWVREVCDITGKSTGEKALPRGVTYFTDAVALRKAIGEDVPTIITGPGEPSQAHQTNEFCYVEKIKQSAEIYFESAKKWCLA